MLHLTGPLSFEHIIFDGIPCFESVHLHAYAEALAALLLAKQENVGLRQSCGL